MVAVDPHAARLNPAGDAVEFVRIARPETGTQPVERVVGNGHGFVGVFESRHRQHRSEDLFLENAHLVMAPENRRFDVVTAFHAVGRTATGQQFGTFLQADVDIGQHFLVLVVAGLSTHHGVGVERVTEFDCLRALNDALHELVVNVFVNQQTRRAGADFALVEGKHHGSFHAFVEERIVVVGDGFHEHVRRLTTQFHCDGNQVFRRILHNQSARGGFARESYFVHALVLG